MFILRFDFRLGPQSDATMGELYRTSLEMCEWGEANGAMTAMFSEHHGANDGYLPASLSSATTVAELRAQNGAYRIVTIDDARQLRDQYGILSLQPLCGGISPEIAWPYLRNLAAL